MCSVEANSEAIIRLSWARALGLPDDALAAPGSSAILAVTGAPDSGTLKLLTLFDSTALVGPAWMVDAMTASLGGELPRGQAPRFESKIAAALAALGPGAREADHQVLGYRDGYSQPEPLTVANPADPDDEGPLVSHDEADLAALLGRCPVDDVNDAAMAGLDMAFTMLDDDHRPLAAAAYRVEHGLLADVRALTAPEHRGRGHAHLLAELIVEDALDSGLIAQSRSHPASLAGARLAAALGFTESGSLIVLTAGA